MARPTLRAASAAALKSRLDEQYASFNQADVVADPIQIVRRFTAPSDVEIVAFLAAGLAFGRVASVMQSVERMVALMGPSPAAFVRRFDPAGAHAGWQLPGHRWVRGPDLAALLLVLRHMLQVDGSIEGFFLVGDDPASPDLGPALDSFGERALAVDVAAAYGGHRPPNAGVRNFFPRPSSGSACKRLNLFLRWMVRRDDVDPGVWTRVSPARLVVPLDTHVIRLGHCLGLTRYRVPGWKMAADITNALRALDPVDPVRYDFALCHIGMANACGFNRPEGDARCPLRGVCRPAARRPRASRRPSDRR